MKTVTLIVEHHSSGRYIRGGGHILSVQEDANEPRPPKGWTSADKAGLWLESNGFEFDPVASKWLDKPGTTVRPRRQQVYRENGGGK